MSVAILKDGTEVKVSKTNRYYQVGSPTITITITVPTEYMSMEEAIAVFSKANTKQITIKTDGSDDVVYTGYAINNIFENADIGENSISINLIKSVDVSDANAIISEYKAKYEAIKAKEEEEEAAIEAAANEVSEEADAIAAELEKEYANQE